LQTTARQQGATEPTLAAASGSRLHVSRPAGNSDKFSMADSSPTTDGTQQDQGSALGIRTSQLLTIQALQPGHVGPSSFMYTGTLQKATVLLTPQTQPRGISLFQMHSPASQPSSVTLCSSSFDPCLHLIPRHLGAAGGPRSSSVPASSSGQHQLQILNKLCIPGRPAVSAVTTAFDATTGERGQSQSASSWEATKQGMDQYKCCPGSDHG
jgi:hypothetical protein